MTAKSRLNAVRVKEWAQARLFYEGRVDDGTMDGITRDRLTLEPRERRVYDTWVSEAAATLWMKAGLERLSPSRREDAKRHWMD
jgi:hypothetical protein